MALFFAQNKHTIDVIILNLARALNTATWHMYQVLAVDMLVATSTQIHQQLIPYLPEAETTCSANVIIADKCVTRMPRLLLDET